HQLDESSTSVHFVASEQIAANPEFGVPHPVLLFPPGGRSIELAYEGDLVVWSMPPTLVDDDLVAVARSGWSDLVIEPGIAAGSGLTTVHGRVYSAEGYLRLVVGDAVVDRGRRILLLVEPTDPAVPFVQTVSEQTTVVMARDGRWIARASGRTGTP